MCSAHDLLMRCTCRWSLDQVLQPACASVLANACASALVMIMICKLGSAARASLCAKTHRSGMGDTWRVNVWAASHKRCEAWDGSKCQTTADAAEKRAGRQMEEVIEAVCTLSMSAAKAS